MAFAGGVAGLVEISLMYPVDLVKTRMQSINPKPKAIYRSFLNSFMTIKRNEGAHRFYRGLPLPLAITFPANSLYWISYEVCAKALSKKQDSSGDLVAQGVSGGLATIVRTFIVNPADVIKQRMQMWGSPHTSSTSCFFRIAKSEGWIAFYRSFPTQVTIEIPFAATYTAVYTYFHNMLRRSDFDPAIHALSGGIAGAAAAIVTTPLDVCRTLLNTQEASTLGVLNKRKVKGLTHALFVVYRLRGVKGFTRGMAARVLYHTPSASLSFLTYEFVKRSFSK